MKTHIYRKSYPDSPICYSADPNAPLDDEGEICEYCLKISTVIREVEAQIIFQSRARESRKSVQ